MRRLACSLLVAAVALVASGCIPIGARVQNMYAPAPAAAPAAR